GGAVHAGHPDQGLAAAGPLAEAGAVRRQSHLFKLSAALSAAADAGDPGRGKRNRAAAHQPMVPGRLSWRDSRRGGAQLPLVRASGAALDPPERPQTRRLKSARLAVAMLVFAA